MRQYTREFLLSLAEKESCRQRPDTLDPLLWRDSPSSDIVDGGLAASPGNKFIGRRDRDCDLNANQSLHEIPEWRRGSANGGLLAPSRRKTYDEEGPPGSSFSSLYPSRGPSNWGEGNHLRNHHERPGMPVPGHTRWDHRSSTDPDRERGGRGYHQWDGVEPDSLSRSGGGRNGWNSSEHDGLLGSGGGLRGPYPPAAGRGADRYNGGGRGGRSQNDSRLNKPSGGFYRADSDSIDGETFGEKQTTEDRAEQERRRRESFELMRKEQKKLKEQKKQSERQEDRADDREVHEIDGLSKLSAFAEQRQVTVVTENELQPVATSPAVVTVAPRPLVPPGFRQKPIVKKKENEGHEVNEVEEPIEKSVPVQEVNHSNNNSLQSMPLQNQQSGEGVDPLAIACSSVSISEAENVFGLADESKMSVFDKLFSKATSGLAVPPSPFLGSQPKSFEKLESSEEHPKMSKFAHLFTFEDEKSRELSRGPFDCSASVDDENPHSLPIKNQGRILPMPVGPSLEDIEKSMASAALDTKESNLNVNGSSTSNYSPPLSPLSAQTFLTCEDIEQSLLAEAKSKTHMTGWSQDVSRSWKEDADSNASQHLLSLLQKGSAKKRWEEKEHTSVVTLQALEGRSTEGIKGEKETAPTLEALFGKSFMMELRSTDAPLSAKAFSETKYVDNVSFVQTASGAKNHAVAVADYGVTFEEFGKPNGFSELSSQVLDGNYSTAHQSSTSHHSLWGTKPDNPGNTLVPSAVTSEAEPVFSFDETNRNPLSAVDVGKHTEIARYPSSELSKVGLFEGIKIKQNVDNPELHAITDRVKLGFAALEGEEFGADSIEKGSMTMNYSHNERAETSIALGGKMIESNFPARSLSRLASEELDGGVLNDFLKFKKAMQHRNKVNDSFLGSHEDSSGIDFSVLPRNPSGGQVDNVSVDVTSRTAVFSSGTNVPPAALYRSHSPVSAVIPKSSSSLQLQQLQQALAFQGSKSTGQLTSKQFQSTQQQGLHPNAFVGNGDFGATPQVSDARYGRSSHNGIPIHGRPVFPLQQQNMFAGPGQHGHFVPPVQTFPQQSGPFMHDHASHDHLFSSKQRVQHTPGYYPPNGSSQALNNLHLQQQQQHGAGHVPPMGFGPPFAPGFAGYPPNEGFLGGEHPAAGGGGLDRWFGRDPNVAGGVSGLIQQRMYGMNKLGFP